jgi:alpha-galactosidase
VSEPQNANSALTRFTLNNSDGRIKVERSSQPVNLAMKSALALMCATFTVNACLIAQAQPKAQPATSANLLAATPPMGWNSWDGYGTTIKEADFKTNAQWLARNLHSYGWEYAVVDMEWFVNNPTPEGNSKNSLYTMDPYGRYLPALNRFPSAAAAAGFKPLADFTHALGLKFGIHILRGIPKSSVEKNLPIAGSSYHAAEAADRSDTCPWNPDNYGVAPATPAGQAYYDSIARLYAQWEVDLIKVDCIASHPYRGEEIRMLFQALQKAGRRMVLSLSPGPAPLEKAEEMGQYAQMWRISNDIWDLWHSSVEYPQGVGDQFANVEKWAGVGGPGHWPDADMLPLGYLGPAPGWGKSRRTELTHDEQRTLMSLWSIFPSPLMLGGDLTAADGWTVSLLTNREVLDVDQHSTGNRVVRSNPETAVLLADAAGSSTRHYLAVFNRSDSTQTLSYSWKDVNLAPGKHKVRDLWEHEDLGEADELRVTVPPHGAVLYAVEVVRAAGS